MANFHNDNGWTNRFAPDLTTLRQIAHEAYARLPADFRALTAQIEIVVEEFPNATVSDDLALETPFDLMGLFQGQAPGQYWTPSGEHRRNRITLYRRAILDYWCENDEPLGEIITHLLISELGHHYGMSDDAIQHLEAIAV